MTAIVLIILAVGILINVAFILNKVSGIERMIKDIYEEELKQ